MTPQSFVKSRLNDMYERPNMWASTKEAFGLQLALLVEVYELDKEKKTGVYVVMSSLFGPGNIVSNAPLDDEWARDRVLRIRGMVEQ